MQSKFLPIAIGAFLIALSVNVNALYSQEPASVSESRGSKLLEKLKQQQKEKLDQLWDDVEKSMDKEDYETAISKLEDILTLDKTSKEAEELIAICQKNLEIQKKHKNKSKDETRNNNLFMPGTKAGERKVVVVNGVEFAFRWCPPGTFIMGSPESEEGRNNNEKQHQVTLTKGYWMLETEVTQKQWKAVMGTNPSFFKGDNLPVEQVSWDDCQEFCKKCAQRGLQVQLPTEAQWEYGCRAGSTTAYFWGNALNGDKANCDGRNPCGTTTKGKSLETTIPVGSYSPNAWGLYDMHGNVREWCSDYWIRDYPRDRVTDPVGPSRGSVRVDRGGYWGIDAKYCRSACRSCDFSVARYKNLGVRVINCQ